MKRFFFFALFLLGCPPTDVDDIAQFDGGFDFDATVARDGSFADSPSDAPVDSTKFNGGGPFLCMGCVCDGTIDMCDFAGGGGAPIADDAGDASACSVDSGPSQCTQIPIQCLPNPTCACLEQATSCACSVDPSGNGFVVTCPPKP